MGILTYLNNSENEYDSITNVSIFIPNDSCLLANIFFQTIG